MKRLIDFNPPKADKIIKTNVRVLSVHKSSQSVVKSCDTNSNNNVPCQKKRVHRSTSTAENDNPFNFVVGSAVRHIDKYGVIKWTGNLPGDKKVYAKVEMVCEKVANYSYICPQFEEIFAKLVYRNLLYFRAKIIRICYVKFQLQKIEIFY